MDSQTKRGNKNYILDERQNSKICLKWVINRTHFFPERDKKQSVNMRKKSMNLLITNTHYAAITTL